ncbi:MAG: hypothetical protein JSR78_09130 [Proteobacteria bacterium]|nr:hypothetical protein [Pseudomonadota bacterium]
MIFNDGGPAFPAEGGAESGLHAHPGMALRDWFAGQSLAAFALDMTDPGITFGDVASNAYKLADAMLKAREIHQ